MVIPVWDYSGSGGLCGYQTRRVFNDDARPKYLTYRSKATDNRLLYCLTSRAPLRGAAAIVLVEDALSAEKLFKVTDAIALLTTTGDSGVLRSIVSKYTHTFIWLDDDNLDVQRKQLQLQKQLDPYVSVSIIRTGKDPKKHSVEELYEATRV